ncbi:MAG: sigma-70 family RNA polymerase sigma factor [Acidobacteria bacterium Pan2503]|uniref:Sigma-70 family RNA polymerase sigma factor n=1 Tax=Candidatus Acidiferrum panamense TaxID=2741543 RepID=A0A7V8SZS6_9BACT|nr:sigma-70 family RNA polymerase sigma factor [Candidatus Acidoferrum panamensis]
MILAGRRGDERATEALFRRDHGLLFQTAFRILGNKQDAEDSLQDALLSAHRNLKSFEGRSQFSTWLTRIVINAALMKRRSIKARPSLSVDDILHEDGLSGLARFADPGPDPEQIYLGAEISEMIHKNIEQLSPRLRIAFQLRHVVGYSTGQAAKKLGVAENALKARVWRARHQLAERLGHALQGMAAP